MFDSLDSFGVIVILLSAFSVCLRSNFSALMSTLKGCVSLSSKAEAICDLPPPISKRQLQRFLGIVNFYRRLLLNCADLILLLTTTHSGPKGRLGLTDEALMALDKIKNLLSDATLLAHPAPEAQLS
nr:unnamed protein product [Spirometra erinaceieuropaei]